VDHPEITEKIADKYSRRMNALVEVLAKAGFSAKKPEGSFFSTSKRRTAVVKPDGSA